MVYESSEAWWKRIEEENRARANAPVGRAEWNEWAIKTRNALVELQNDDTEIFKEWTDEITECVQRCDAWINKIQKKLDILDKKEARIDAAILRAETLEKCYLTVFKSALDKNSVQPQETPAPAPARKEDAPIEGTPAPSVAPPAPAMAAQVKGFLPTKDEILSYPNIAQIGDTSIRKLQKLVGIMDRKALTVFTQDNAQEWLRVAERTSYLHITSWLNCGVITKNKGVYEFLPPQTATAPLTQPKGVAEGSQPAV